MNDTIQREPGRHFVQDDKGIAGEITYSETPTGTMIVDSTEVRADRQGAGLARRLLDSVVAQARAEGKRIVPLCPYASAQFAKHTEYDDVNALL